MEKNEKSDLSPDEKIARIKKALRLAHDTHSWEDVLNDLDKGAAQMFDGPNGCWITRIEQAPQKRFLNTWIVAGRMPGVMDLQLSVDHHALEHGCRFISATVRPGWAKHLKTYGWKLDALVITRDPRNGLD